MKRFALALVFLLCVPGVASAALVNDGTAVDDAWGTPVPPGHIVLDVSLTPTSPLGCVSTGLLPGWEVGLNVTPSVFNPYLKAQVSTFGNTVLGLVGGIQLPIEGVNRILAIEGVTSTSFGPVLLDFGLGIGQDLGTHNVLGHGNCTVYYTLLGGQSLFLAAFATGAPWASGEQLGMSLPFGPLVFTGSFTINQLSGSYMGLVPQVGLVYSL